VEDVFTQLAPIWTLAAIAAGVVFVAAVLAEGRGAHIIRMILMYDRRRGIDSVLDEALTSGVERGPQDLGVVAHLGRSEQRYTELDARRARKAARSRSDAA